jgi:hypothetical protein
MCGNGSRDELQDLQAESNGKFGAMDMELGSVSLRSWVVVKGASQCCLTSGYMTRVI